MNLPKIEDNLLKGVKSLDINKNVVENKENVKVEKSSAEEEVIGEKAINSIHLPYKHISMKTGKNLRSKLLRAFNYWFKLKSSGQSQEMLAEETVEMAQNVTLLLDDIQDNSLVRRGLPCAHLVYGVPSTINSATYYIFVGLQRVLENSPKDRLYEVISEVYKTLMDLHLGQQMDIYWRDNLVVPTLEEYKKMIDLKTTTGFSFLYRVLKAGTNSDVNLDRFCYLLGQLFQIRDDYINLKDEEYQKLKGFAEDLTEGKFSFPIIHGIREDPKDSTILSILKMHTDNVELKKMVIDKLEELGSFEYTKKYLDELEAELLAELAKLDDNPLIKDVLKPILSNYIA